MTEPTSLEVSRQILYEYDAEGQLTRETHSNPVVEEEGEIPSEFAGVTHFADVLHDGVQDLLDQGFYIYKVYQKNTILMKSEVKPK